MITTSAPDELGEIRDAWRVEPAVGNVRSQGPQLGEAVEPVARLLEG